MSAITIRPGGLVTKDPNDAVVCQFDWGTSSLANAQATIASQTYRITTIKAGGDASLSATITRSGTTATVTTASAHGYATNNWITIAGATQTDYNGTVKITVLTTTTFSYTVANSPTTPATGTITSTSGMVADNASVLSSSPYLSRWTQVRLLGGTQGALYEVTNNIVTDETPAQHKDRFCLVSIEDR